MEGVFAPAAVADLIAIRHDIGRFNPAAARRMALRLKAAAESLREFPERGRCRADGAWELVAVPPYVIIYDVDSTCVTILWVWHGAQN